jgi:hypothetical protein
MLNVIMLNVIMLNVVMPNVVMVNVIMLSVEAPLEGPGRFSTHIMPDWKRLTLTSTSAYSCRLNPCSSLS